MVTVSSPSTADDLRQNGKATTACQVAQLYFHSTCGSSSSSCTGDKEDDEGQTNNNNNNNNKTVAATRRTYIITGATSGLGRQLALVLGTTATTASSECHHQQQQRIHLILAVRNVAQGNELVQEIHQSVIAAKQQQQSTSKAEDSRVSVPSNGCATATPAADHHAEFDCNILVWYLDLTRLESVRQFVQQYKEWSNNSKISSSDASTQQHGTNPSKEEYDVANDDDDDKNGPILIDGLVNNAGVYGVKGLTEDGFLIPWQVNTLAPFLLTQLLEPYFSKTARVVNVSSLIHAQVGMFGGNAAIMNGLDLRAACCPKNKKVDIPSRCPPPSNHSTTYDYAFSKACQVLHAHALTLQFGQDQQQQSANKNAETTPGCSPRRLAFAVDPGVIRTNISRNQTCMEWFVNRYIVHPLCGRSLDQGCATILFCLIAPTQDLIPQ